jgi:8-oxo-dGTP diphosphatase
MEEEKKVFTYRYPHPAVTADCVVFGFDGKGLKVLLIERGNEPYKGMWAFPGGFMNIDESAEECAVRELREETTLELTDLRQLGTFSAVNRDPRERVITVAFYALARKTEVRGGDDAARAKWWPIDEIPQLAFDHDYILRQAMRRIRQDIHFEPVGFGLLDEEFSISELQRLYESILGVRFDRRNFYRKMLQTGILHEVECNTSAPAAFGRHGEMKKMSIDALFGAAAPASPALPMSANESAADEECEEDHAAVRRRRLFRFDEEGYTRMKEEGGFRLEF